MLDLNWNAIEQEYQDIIRKLSDVSLDQEERARLQKKSSQFSSLLSIRNQIFDLQKSNTDLKHQIETEKDAQMKELLEEEVSSNNSKINALNQNLENLLYPPDQRDHRSVFVEIRAGAGGQEAALFVSDLFRMYSNYALSKGWTVSIVDSSSTDLGGYKELILYIKGKDVYKFLKFESGVHRVQRVPQTETAGRIHTSTVTVVVLPEAEDVDIQINPQDLRIDVYRSGGAGGQHVNTTDSAVRITHIPTGLVVTCQDERSQIKNKAKALKVLKSRLLQAEQDKREAAMSAQRKQQVGMGERAEKIRTYNFPQNRVTDHRVGLTLKKLDMVIEGRMDDLIDPLLVWDLEQRRKKESEFLK